MSNKVVLLAALMILLLIVSGCTVTQQEPVMEFESGVNDQNYRGVNNPTLDPVLKLSEQEQREGVQKITIKCGVQIDMPNSDAVDDNDQPDEEAEAEGEERVGPKI